jgi:hypothetical protein
MEQFVQMVGTMQKRICDKQTVDDDAKSAQKELLEFMTQPEIDELAKSPVAGTVKDLTPLERQLIAAFCAEKKGNPLYNQHQLEVEDITARLGSDFVPKVLLPDQDPTEQAEQQRQQMLELMLLSHGEAVPVSKRDNHMIHLQVLMPSAEQLAGQMSSGQFGTPSLEAVIAHINEHYNNAIQQGVKPEALAQIKEFLAKAGKALAQLQAHDQAAQQLSQAHDQLTQGGAPLPPGATPVIPAPNGNNGPAS